MEPKGFSDPISMLSPYLPVCFSHSSQRDRRGSHESGHIPLGNFPNTSSSHLSSQSSMSSSPPGLSELPMGSPSSLFIHLGHPGLLLYLQNPKLIPPAMAFALMALCSLCLDHSSPGLPLTPFRASRPNHSPCSPTPSRPHQLHRTPGCILI